MNTPEQVAQNVLDAHAIKPHWNRSGEQVAGLIAEAVAADRAARIAEIDSDWQDDIANIGVTDYVEVKWAVWGQNGRKSYASDMVLSAEQAVGMFTGIGEATL